MTTPKLPPTIKSITTPPSSTTRQQVLLLKILFILLILLLFPKLVDSRGGRNSGAANKKRRKLNAEYYTLRDTCARSGVRTGTTNTAAVAGDTVVDIDGGIDNTDVHDGAGDGGVENCGMILVEENEMCIASCMSDACFEKMYVGRLLERGEVDEGREREFELCVKGEIKAVQQELRRAYNKR